MAVLGLPVDRRALRSFAFVRTPRARPVTRLGTVFNGDVEVQDLLADAQLAVESDRGIVAVIGLNHDNPGAPFPGDGADGRDQRGRNPAPPVRLGDGEVVDVEFRALLLELHQLVGRKRPHDAILVEREQRDEPRIGEKPLDIGGTGTLRGIAGRILEDGPEEVEHGGEPPVVPRGKSVNSRGLVNHGDASALGAGR